jgi:hypothetical protein
MSRSDFNQPQLSLLTAFRGAARRAQLELQLRWLERIRQEEGFTNFEIIVVEGDETTLAESHVAQYEWAQYEFVPMSGLFHKGVLLNRAARLARGDFLMPFDVDLLPAEGVLPLHLELATASPRCLVAGYRLQLTQAQMPAAGFPLPTSHQFISQMDIEDASLLGPEDNLRPLRKYLINKERFGVCPCFPRHLFEAVGGNDEVFIGRGPEDQDLVEKVCASGLTLVRAYDLIYFHLYHAAASGWDEPNLLAANRKIYAERRQARQSKV